jgi:hypothetical protein
MNNYETAPSMGSPWVEPGARSVVAERTIGDSLIHVTAQIGILKQKK